MSVELDKPLFHQRLKTLVSGWQASINDASADELFSKAGVIVIATGTADDEHTYQKSTSVQTWLLGYEFPDSILVITDKKVVFLASAKKASMIASLQPTPSEQSTNQWLTIETLERPKNTPVKPLMEQIIRDCQPAKRIGHFPKDTFTGDFYTEWLSVLQTSKMELVDVSPGIASILSVKDEPSLKLCRQAAEVCTLAMNRLFIREMEAIIDEERQVTHAALAESIESLLLDQEQQRKRLKLPADIQGDMLDWCYTPIIQSGDTFDLKPSAFSDMSNLQFGTIICSMGVRYNSWCANVARTFLIEPTKTQEANYLILLELHETLARTMRPGLLLSDIYDRAVQWLSRRRPDLSVHFLKNCGFSMGIEFRESSLILSAKHNNRALERGMIFNLSLGLQDLEQENGTKYSLFLADTVEIRDDEGVFLTTVSRIVENIAYFFKKDGEVDDHVTKEPVTHLATEDSVASRRRAATALNTMSSQSMEDTSTEQKRQQHQQLLRIKLQKDGESKFTSEGKQLKQEGNEVSFTNQQTMQRMQSYKTPKMIPKEALMRPKIFIDRQHSTVILPIYGVPVPFHIGTIKNVSKSEEGEFVYLRVNFVSPGQAFGKKTELPFSDPQATFLREVSYRSTDTRHINEAFRLIQELRKRIREQEAEQREKEDLIVQAELQVVRGKPVPRLSEVSIRPALAATKRTTGSLECHSNGLRYATIKGERVDILYGNVKHLFFQPCDNEMIVLMHCHLRHPIMIGKKKTMDVQFYREVSDMMVEETNGGRRKSHFFDKDELEEEQEERRRRKAMNREFKMFSEKVMEACASTGHEELEVDVPFRDLGFFGVPFRSTVFLQPTTDCLVQLSEPPFLVLTLSEVEIAHFERVQFGLKNFDLVFVYKDYQRPVLHINSIPMNYLEHIKDWLDSVDIPFSEGAANLNWNAIMKHITSDIGAFYEEGGWSFLQEDNHEGGGGGEDGEGGDDDEDDESGSEFEEEEDSADDEDESESDEEGEDEDSEFDEDEEEDEEEEEGEDWSDLEEEAAQEDRKRHRHSDGEGEDDGRKRKSQMTKRR